MKRLINILGLLCLFGGLGGCTQDPIQDEATIDPPQTRTATVDATDYYWHRGGQVGVDVVSDKKYVLLQTAPQTRADVPGVQFVKTPSSVTLSGNINPVTVSDDSSSALQNAKKLSWAIVTSSSVSNLPDVLYEAPCFTSANGTDLALSHLFYVKLKSTKDADELLTLASEYGVEVLGNNEYMPLWYTLACTNESAGNALDMANQFYESGKFRSCQPCFVNDEDLTTAAPNDPLFPTQWGLNNTGQNGGTAGIDINVLDAHTVTRGNANIIVAVLDHGTQLNHPDLNVYPKSYDTETGTSPSVIQGNHGTACSGIISAKINNGLGITGVAPECPVMSISNRLMSYADLPQKLADGFNYAWRNGAAVISNSWHAPAYSEFLEDAIQSALDNGRNGLGCVVVFAAGNDNVELVNYPARFSKDILAVGAMSYNGARKSPQSIDGEYWWGSNYGAALDVIAPGVKIQTTDRTGSNGYSTGDYTPSFNGTSSACPHVAAVAALVLSVNPSLTQRDVCDVIEQGARKIPAYTYSSVANRPNGTWNKETGYGLVDAYAAVLLAQYLGQNTDITLENREFSTDMSFSATGWIYMNNVTVMAGSALNLTVGSGVEIIDALEVDADATLVIERIS